MNELFKNNYTYSLLCILQALEPNIDNVVPLFDKDKFEPYQIDVYYKDRDYITSINTSSFTLKQATIEIIKKGVFQ